MRSEADLLVTELIANMTQHSPDTDELTAIELDKARDLVVGVSHAHPPALDSPRSVAGFTLLDRLAKTWGPALSRWRPRQATALRLRTFTPGPRAFSTGLWR